MVEFYTTARVTGRRRGAWPHAGCRRAFQWISPSAAG